MPTFAAIEEDVDGVVVTDLNTTAETIAAALLRFDGDRVLVPRSCCVRAAQARGGVMIDYLATIWYVVRTHARGEAKASLNLARQGFATYLPRYLKRRRHARRVEMVPAPLFPRYLFVAIDIAVQRWRSIQSTFGVAQLVCNGELPSAVSAEVVDELSKARRRQRFHTARTAQSCARRKGSGGRRRIFGLSRPVRRYDGQ